MGRNRNVEQRKLIVSKAYEMFYQNGYDAIKMKDIAKECGISLSLLQHYFSQKENLVVEIFNDLIIKIHHYIDSLFDVQKSVELRSAMFYRLFYEVLIYENNKLLELYYVILGDADLLCRATDYAISQFYSKVADKSLEDNLSLYILNGTLSQLFTLYMKKRLPFRSMDIVTMALSVYFGYLGNDADQVDAMIKKVDGMINQEVIDTFIESYQNEII